MLPGGIHPTTRLLRTGLAAAALGAALSAAPAQATVVTPGPAGHTIMVVHNMDFVSLAGFPKTSPVTVDVVRNGQIIGTRTGTPEDGPDGEPVLDINHGTPNCFAGTWTPDILPGDRIRATQTAPDVVVPPDLDADGNPIPGTGSTTPGAVTTMETIVDDIALTGEPALDAAGNVIVKGRASSIAADGTRTPMDPAALDGSEIVEKDLVNRLVGTPTSVIRTPGTTDGFSQVWNPATPIGDKDPYGTGAAATAQRRATLLASRGYVGGFGHIEPPPADVQLVEGFDDVPEPGAEGCPAGRSNAVTGLDDQSININSGTLVVSGTIMPGVTAVTARAAGATGTPITAPATITGTNWTATFNRADLADGGLLPNGQVTVSADYTWGANTLFGRTVTIDKDLAAPAAAVPSLAAGTYEGARSLTLSAAAGDRIEYATNGGAFGAYNGAIPLRVGTTTLSVRVTDAAGNITTTTLRYVINAVPVVQQQQQQTAAPAPVVAPVIAQSAVFRPAAPSLKAASKRLKVSAARRKGLSTSFTAPNGAKVVVGRLYRLSGSTRSLVSSKRLSVRAGRKSTLKFGGKTLKAGLYLIEVRAGTSSNALGAPGIVRIRVVR